MGIAKDIAKFIENETMKKKNIKLLICIWLILSVVLITGVMAEIGKNTAENCLGCIITTVTEKGKDTANATKASTGSAAQVKRIECFNCDQRPCVATKEAWIRLWHKYWGVDIASKANSSPAKEDR
jgi:hypothetical protein